jgi:hypothetical protein
MVLNAGHLSDKKQLKGKKFTIETPEKAQGAQSLHFVPCGPLIKSPALLRRAMGFFVFFPQPGEPDIGGLFYDPVLGYPSIKSPPSSVGLWAFLFSFLSPASRLLADYFMIRFWGTHQ